jgi:H+/Cl- antiporter ClcA/CBS domain-containing protein
MKMSDFTAGPRMIALSAIAVVIGVVATFVARALLALIALATNFFYFQRLSFAPALPAEHHLGALAVLVPVAGALVIGAMARYGSDRIRGHGIPEALEAILVGGSRVKPKVALLKPLSAAISIGSGGPFGAEGPIIMTGGACGSLVAQLFSLTSAERKTLLVAGAAAGMSATFSSPLAAALLGVELMLFEWKPRSFVPVALASATAAIARHSLIGPGPLFPTPPHAEFAGVPALLCCVLAGLGAGLLATALTAAVYAAEDAFEHVPLHWMWWPAFGGLAIGIGGLIEPRALGIGFETIGELLHEGLVPRAILVLVVVKALIWSISLGSGTSGGVLAPLLMMGAALGALEAHVFPGASVGFWPLVGMGAILGGTMRSPFTGIVFVIELTHDLNLLLPLAVAVTVAHAFTVLVLRRSILTEKVARRGFHVSREYATDELEVLFVRDAMNTTFAALPAERTVAEALTLAPEPRDDRSQHLFPVLAADANLVGAVSWAELRALAAEPGAAERGLASVAERHPPRIFSNESLRMAVERMAETGATRLLVVNPADSRKLVGKLALHDVLAARSRHLQDERRRERILPVEYVLPRGLRAAVVPVRHTRAVP